MDATRRSEFEKKAFHVVERLLDVPVDVSFFLDAVSLKEAAMVLNNYRYLPI